MNKLKKKFFDITKSHKSKESSDKALNAHSQVNMKMSRNLLVIWLDSNIDEENNADCRDTISQLQCITHPINTFIDADQCIKFLQTVDNNNKAHMIISGSLGQYVVPYVHDMSPVDSIFIFCNNQKYHEQWAKDWSKIKGVYTEIGYICEALKQTARQSEQNAISISFMGTSDDMSKKNLDQLDCSFMYTKIFKEILLKINFEQEHIQEFIQYCREQFTDHQVEWINIKELERKYHKQTPIWWYTYDSCLYSMLNQALRILNVNIIIKMGFFMNDLHRHIQELHTQQFTNHQSSDCFIVYRGQSIFKEDFEQMKKTKGGLMAFNNFLSTTKDLTIALPFARNALAYPDLVGILFVMKINPSISTTPFAYVKDVSYFQREDEVLFSMHAIFRICDIKSMYENQCLYQVVLTLTSDDDKDLRLLTDRIREETDGSTGWDQLGKLLLKLREGKKAQQVYEILLDQTTEEIEKAHIYYQIGWAKDLQGEYRKALAFYGKSLKIRQENLPPNHPDLAKTYNNIGVAYCFMRKYSKALSSHEKALEIRQQSLSSNHPDLAKSYHNIGWVYLSMDEYSKALPYYEKALAIRQKSLPPNHPDLAASYNNMGLVYFNMDEYLRALAYYEKALAIQEQSLPWNHPDLACCYNNIGWIYENLGEYAKAHLFCKRALHIAEQTLPLHHPAVQEYRGNSDRIKRKL